MSRVCRLPVLLCSLLTGLVLPPGALISAGASPLEVFTADHSFGATDPSPDSRQQESPAPIAQVRRDLDEDEVPDRVGDTVVVAGRVTAEPGAIPVPEKGVGALQDSTGGIHVLLPRNQTLSRGDSAQVRGVLRHENNLAYIEGLGSEIMETSGHVPAPIPLSVPSAAAERHEGRFARVEGRITTRRSANEGGEYFVLREEEGADAQLTVFVSDRHTERIPIGRFEKGDEVAVTGVIGQYELSYQILPRGVEDLSQVGQVQTYLWWGLLGIGGFGLASLIAIMSLRAAVRRRTQELEQSREKLREKENRLRSITENVSDGIYRSIEKEGLVYANQTFLDLFGYSSLEEVREIDPAELYADPARREELIEQEAREGRLEGVEVRYQRKDGTRFVGLLSTRQFEKESGEKTYHDGAITDITDRKRHEQKLKRRGEDVEALYETTRGLLEAESQEAIYDQLHAVLQRVFDYDLINTAIREGTAVRPVRTDRRGAAEATLPGSPLADGDSISARVLQEGETVVVKDTKSLENGPDYGGLRSVAGVPIGEHGAIVVGRAGEKTFDRFNLRLIEVLAGYGALVLGRLGREEKLAEAKKEAEAASRAKSSFLASMSHEIRTPLTSIIGFAEALGTEVAGLELSAESPLSDYAGLIEKGGKRLLKTLEGVLNLSKLEAGQMDLSVGPVDLATEARRAAEEFRPKAKEKGLRLEVEALEVEAGDRPRARADEGGVQIVLQNLLSNAIKYTEEGSVQVRTYEKDGEAAILEVEDTGIGMEQSVAEDLFEPFRQASEGLGREHEGTGVGLAVMKRAVEEMNGSVNVETQKGEGSRFTVRLPPAEESASEGSRSDASHS